jgi:hypothetical protein
VPRRRSAVIRPPRRQPFREGRPFSLREGAFLLTPRNRPRDTPAAGCGVARGQLPIDTGGRNGWFPDAPVRPIGRTISDDSYRISTLGITRRRQQKGRERPDLSTLCKVSGLAHLDRSDISFNRPGLLIGGRVRAVDCMPITGWHALRERCAHAKAQSGRSDEDYLFHQILHLQSGEMCGSDGCSHGSPRGECECYIGAWSPASSGGDTINHALD